MEEVEDLTERNRDADAHNLDTENLDTENIAEDIAESLQAWL